MEVHQVSCHFLICGTFIRICLYAVPYCMSPTSWSHYSEYFVVWPYHVRSWSSKGPVKQRMIEEIIHCLISLMRIRNDIGPKTIPFLEEHCSWRRQRRTSAHQRLQLPGDYLLTSMISFFNMPAELYNIDTEHLSHGWSWSSALMKRS